MTLRNVIEDELEELRLKDRFLHQIADIAVRRTDDLIKDECYKVDAFRAMVARLKSYSRSDLHKHLTLMESSPRLATAFLQTISMLNAKQFSLHVQRLSSLYALMTVNYGFTSENALESLFSYPNADPGKSHKHSLAIFLLTAMLSSSIEGHRIGRTESEGSSYCLTSAAYPGINNETWTISELTPSMIDFAWQRNDDIDNVLAIIKDRGAWHREAISYFLDGGLPTEGSEVTVLANTLISDICKHAQWRENIPAMHLENPTPKRLDRELQMTHSSVRRAVNVMCDYQQQNDVEALRLHMKYAPTSVGEGASRRVALRHLINDLRTVNYPGIESVITGDMIDRVDKVQDALMFDNPLGTAMLQSKPDGPNDLDSITTALRVSVALGSAEVASYITANMSRVMNLSFEFKAYEHEALLELVKAQMEHGAVSDGIL